MPLPLSCVLGSHDWKRVYLSKDSCRIQERCSRCEAVKGLITVIHTWEWIVRNPCLSQQVCKRCGATGQINQKEHQWSKVYVDEHSCMAQEKCSQCGTVKGEFIAIHQWKESYKLNSYEIQKTCERCGTITAYKSEFSTFIGQEENKQKLVTLIASARKKKEPLHHILLCSQPEMGKVALAKVLANEMGVNCKTIFGINLETPGDCAAFLTNMRAGDFLIIEQIEEMRKPVVEVLIPAAEDFSLDVVIGKGSDARNIKLKLPRFTIICTTSKPSRVDKRISSLFFIFNFAPYTLVENKMIIRQSAKLQDISIPEEVIDFLAEHINGCPGDVLSAIKKLRNYSAYSGSSVSLAVAKEALTELSINGNPSLYERLPIPDDVKMFVWQRDGGHCVKCGSQENLEYDHIIPISKGGSNSARNIQLLCEKCNRSKGGNII